MTAAVHAWWIGLWVVAVINIAAWAFSAVILMRKGKRFAAQEYKRRRLLLWLSAGYVVGCAFRSFLPRIDLLRICLLDTGLSSVVVGRGVATVAELCFMSQCALLLHHVGKTAGSRFTLLISMLLVPLIVMAEITSWYAVLSTDYFGHVLENSLWTVAALLLMVCFMLVWSGSGIRQRRFLGAMMVFTGGYIIFMIGSDVPMYWVRWVAQLHAGVEYLTISQGLVDAARQCIVSFDWTVWRQEIPWMTLYFSVAVWVSILLPHAPAWRNELRGESSILIKRNLI